ncbi:MAG TPA: M20/M25/M40 family metallo-hydrolase [Candidatus Lokiarchaeia archaeon]|nr:M20/M25/M40 family metallo-hydrolase [Candidatus Lokiarchaeia archaeon]
MAWTSEEELAILRDSIQVYAPSFQEKPIIELLEKVFDNTNTSFTVDDFGNVKAVAGSDSPVVLLASHMDTIASELPFSEDDLSFHGRGAVDCRPSLFALALAARRVLEKGFHGTIIFGGIAAEEVSTDGIKMFLESMQEAPDLAIFGEPTGSTKICIAYKGRVWLKISVTCQAGHVAAAWIHVNAIEIIDEFYTILKERLQALIKNKELTPFFSPRATITTISAGSIPNMLPAEATGDIDVRFPPGIEKENIIGLCLAIKDELQAVHVVVDPTLTITIEIKSSIGGIRVSQDNEMCTGLASCIEKVTCEKPSFVKKTGTTFMNHIGTFFNCPVVTYGPGDPSLEHTADERVEKKEFLEAIDILESFLLNLSG